MKKKDYFSPRVRVVKMQAKSSLCITSVTNEDLKIQDGSVTEDDDTRFFN